MEEIHRVMGSSRTVTLFSDRPEPSQRPSSFVVSIAVHVAVFALLSLGIVYNPRIKDSAVAERYTIRHLAMHMPEWPQRPSSHANISFPGPQPSGGPSDGDQDHQAKSSRPIPGAAPGPQTLVQPKIHSHLALKEEVPVPDVLIWKPEPLQAETIVPPLPQRSTPADVRPSPDAPNDELSLSDIGISSTDRAEQNPPILPGTTSPLVVRGPDPPTLPPETASQSAEQPTPAAILSLSNLRMTEGTAVLPPVNESARVQGNGIMADHAKTAGKGSSGAGSEKGNGGATAGNTAPRPSNPGSIAEPKMAKAAPPAAGPSSNAGGSNALGAVAHIALPKDGGFGAVVVGSSLREKYPETAELWTGRMAYTVYLHVGLSKSWILQYSLPHADETGATGNTGHIEAPWPYNIVRPNITPGDINADALMVHGYVNQSGRFESLAVAFPPDFTQTPFVLAALAQWEFRPATQNGQPAKVEVLLIIPDMK